MQQGGVEKHLYGPKPEQKGSLGAILEPAPTATCCLSHFLHDLVTFMGVRGRAAGTRRTGLQGGRPLHVPGSDPRGRAGLIARSNWSRCAPPPGPTLVVIEWVRQLGGRRFRLLFLALRGISSDWRSLVMCARPPTLMVQRGGTGTKR